MVQYKNSFHNPKYQGSEAIIETDARPVKYIGYLIYHRIKTTTPGGNVFDIVKDGICAFLWYAGSAILTYVENKQEDESEHN